MNSLEKMCHILNRLLEIDPVATERLLSVTVPCTSEAWPALLADSDITVRLVEPEGSKPGGVVLTPMLLVNSLVAEKRYSGDRADFDGEYAIFRDLADDGSTMCFFVARVNRADDKPAEPTP